MKDNEQQIEEMAKHGCYDGCASGLRKFCDEYDGKPCKNMVRIASGLYEQGYRKLPDGAVVLLIGENNQALDEKTIEYFVKHNEEIRKEAVKDFAEKLKMAFFYEFDEIIPSIMSDKIDELLKEYEK